VRALEPVSVEAFFAEHWERQPLVVARGEPGRFDDLLSEADVERLLCSSGIRYPAFRLVKEGTQIPPGEYTRDIPWRPPITGAADVAEILAQWESGATVVFQALHLNWRPVAVFCRDLERALGQPVQTNAYYTPRGSQGFAVHHDTHDVFVLQVAGEKRWLVYAPLLELPLKQQRFSQELGEPGEPTHVLTLEAGDTLYLPRGWLHQAETSDTDSLHLTVGINTHTWMDAFKSALEDCAAEIGFRRGVPADGIGGEDLVALLSERLDPEAVVRRMRRRFVQTRRPVPEGELSQLRALEALEPETAVERRPTVIADVEADGDEVVLLFEGKEVRFPAFVRADVEFCAVAEQRFSAADLPGELDAEGRLVLVRRLVREGFLRLCDPATDASDDAPSPHSDGHAGA
jgi:lysine-specific demethylase/histidyl-hydroxylase NO66